MADITIYIRLKVGTQDQLELKNDDGDWGEALTFYTQVAKNDTVIWQLAENSGIDQLTGIEAKDGRFDLFPPNQPKAKGNGTWQGKIKDIDSGSDKYNISYLAQGIGHTVDPELSTDPPPPPPPGDA